MRLVERARETYDTVLEQYPTDFGKALSKKERQEKALPHTTLIYGEIDFDSFGNSCIYTIAVERI
jgi:hypothetical protein